MTHRATGPEPDEWLVTVIRGVGSSAPDASKQACRALLEERQLPIRDLEEVNWSWQDFFPSAYGRHDEDEGTLDVVDLAFLQRLGIAFRHLALLGIQEERLEGTHVLVAKLRRSCANLLQLTPGIALVSAFLAALGWGWLALLPLALTSASALCLVVLPARISLRHRAAAALRAVVGLFLWPLILVLVVPVTKKGAWVVSVSVLFVFQRIADNVLHRVWQPTESEQLPGVPAYDDTWLTITVALATLVVAAVGLVVLIIVYSALRRLMAPLLKILADVVLYLGDDDYRTALWDHARDILARTTGSTRGRLLLLTHSLGTVIVVDVLRRIAFTGASQPTEITLITSGSPLSRLFHAFFPAQYPTPAEIQDELTAKHPCFRWLNVYRPADPIGRSLALHSSADVSTAQPHPWWTAHIDYWSDRKVHDTVWSALAVHPTRPNEERQFKQKKHSLSWRASLQPAGDRWLRYTILVLCVWLGSSVVFSMYITPLLKSRRTMEAVTRGAAEVTGRLYVLTERVRGGDHGSIDVAVPRYTVSFTHPRTHRLISVTPNSAGCRFASLESLLTKNDVEVLAAPHPDSRRLARVIPVRIRYSLENPDHFIVAECARTVVPMRLWIAGCAAFIATMPLLLILSVGVMRFLDDVVAALAGFARRHSSSSADEAMALVYRGSLALALATFGLLGTLAVDRL